MTAYTVKQSKRLAATRNNLKLAELRPLMRARGWRWNGYDWVPLRKETR